MTAASLLAAATATRTGTSTRKCRTNSDARVLSLVGRRIAICQKPEENRSLFPCTAHHSRSPTCSAYTQCSTHQMIRALVVRKNPKSTVRSAVTASSDPPRAPRATAICKTQKEKAFPHPVPPRRSLQVQNTAGPRRSESLVSTVVRAAERSQSPLSLSQLTSARSPSRRARLAERAFDATVGASLSFRGLLYVQSVLCGRAGGGDGG